MKENNYTKLKKELPAMAKIVAQFPENVQQHVFELLLQGFNVGLEEVKHSIDLKLKDKKNTNKSGELPGIASFQNGNFTLTVRDAKASSQADAVKRITYIAIRAYLRQNQKETSVSRKTVINPILTKWRLYDANARSFLANDKGILRDKDNLSLDVHATEEADKFIEEVNDSKIVGSWSPGGSGGKRKAKPAKRNK